MKRLIIILFSAIFGNVFCVASAIEGDRIFINGQYRHLLSNPLGVSEDLFKRVDALFPKKRTWITSDPDNTIVYWSINNGQLCLDSIIAYINDSIWGFLVSPDTMRNIFKDYYKSDRIVATWLTQDLRIALGKEIYYEHGGFERYYDEELILSIEKGKVVRRQIFHNKVAVEGVSYNDFKAFSETIANCYLSLDRYPELTNEKRIIFQISNIRLDSLGNLTNCEIEVVRPRRYEVLAQEMRTYLMQVHPWKTLYIHGKYRPELPIITFPYETKWHKTSSMISTDQ